MHITDILNLIGLGINILGTILIFKGTFSLEPYPFAVCGSSLTTAQDNEKYIKRNSRRLKLQHIGMLCLMTGFLLQFFAILIPYF